MTVGCGGQGWLLGGGAGMEPQMLSGNYSGGWVEQEYKCVTACACVFGSISGRGERNGEYPVWVTGVYCSRERLMAGGPKREASAGQMQWEATGDFLKDYLSSVCRTDRKGRNERRGNSETIRRGDGGWDQCHGPTDRWLTPSPDLYLTVWATQHPLFHGPFK